MRMRRQPYASCLLDGATSDASTHTNPHMASGIDRVKIQVGNKVSLTV